MKKMQYPERHRSLSREPSIAAWGKLRDADISPTFIKTSPDSQIFISCWSVYWTNIGKIGTKMQKEINMILVSRASLVVKVLSPWKNYINFQKYPRMNLHFCTFSRVKMTMMSNDLVLVRTPAPITRHMVSLFPPTLLHWPHCSCPVHRLRSFCWLCDPCNKSQYNEVQSSCISSTKEMYIVQSHILHIKENL